MDKRASHSQLWHMCRGGIASLAIVLFSLPVRAEIVLAGNEQVLQAWQQLAQNGAPDASLTRQDDGSTNIEWHGNVTVDGYNNTISGNQLLTPMKTGDFYKASVQGDLRETLASGGMSYMQFGATHSNDRAVLTENSQLDTFQAGIVEHNFGLAIGDVTAGFSTLGTNTQMKGVYGYRQFDGVVVSASVGKMVESWEVLAGTAENSQYESSVHALKVDMAVGKYGRLFLTNQAFIEDEESLAVGLRPATAAQADTTTAGFAYQKDSITLQGEVGSSNWEESSGYSYQDSAAIIDGQWRGEKGGISAGYHDIGGYYSSLSASVTPGVDEGYIGADWLPADWLSMVVDLRRSEYEHATNATDIETTDAVTVQLGLGLEKLLAGLNLSVQQSLSTGTTIDESSNVVDDYAVNLSYTSQFWSTQFGNSYQEVENSSYPETNSTTDTWTYALNVSLNRRPEVANVWSVDLGLNGSLQEQELESSAGIINESYTLSMGAQRVGWGSLVASYTNGLLTQAAGGPEIEQVQTQIEASRNWGKKNSIKLYLRDNGNSGDVDSNYTETTVGMQVAMLW